MARSLKLETEGAPRVTGTSSPMRDLAAHGCLPTEQKPQFPAAGNKPDSKEMPKHFQRAGSLALAGRLRGSPESGGPGGGSAEWALAG